MFVLFTDTDTDMTPTLAKEYGYHLISMPYVLDDKVICPYEDFDEFDHKTYYQILRNGTIPKTTAVSPARYIEYFEPHFKDGNDILYIHFSTALSGTFNAMNIAIEELKEKYPERKIYTVDTKAISICSLVMLEEAAKLYKDGKTAEEIVEFITNERDKYAVYFYADDLKFFKRSGRVSNFSAIMGTILGIHPIIYIDENGIMTSISKGKGQKGTLKKLLNYVIELEDHIKDHPVIIAHADAIEIAKMLGQMLKDQFGEDLKIEYSVVNPTAGAHCGPDTIGVAFHAKHR